MNDNETTQEMVARLQRVADSYSKGEVELTLENEPRLYRLPKCTKAGLIHHSSDKVDLLLDTEGEHRFLIELNSKTAATLLRLLELTFNGPPEG
jgi:citrate lyase beta subunit